VKSCDRSGCKNEGTRHPVLLLTPVGHPESKGAEFIIGILVCEEHQASTKPADLIAEREEDQWDSTAGARGERTEDAEPCRGRGPPTRLLLDDRHRSFEVGDAAELADLAPAVPLLRSALAIVTEAARALAAARLGLVTDDRHGVGFANHPGRLDTVVVGRPADPDVAMRPRLRRERRRVGALVERELGKVNHQDIATGW